MNNVGERRFDLCSNNTDIYVDLPEGSYERVVTLAKLYWRRLIESDSPTVANYTDNGEGRIDPLLKEEVVQRSRIEKEEADAMSVVKKRWTRRSAAFAPELLDINERMQNRAQEARRRAFLEDQLYRQQFLDFWEKRKGKEQHKRRSVDGTKFIMNAYKFDVLPFATNPVDCWERGLIASPEVQKPVVLSDDKGSISLPLFYELSMKLRESYDRYRAQKDATVCAGDLATNEP